MQTLVSSCLQAGFSHQTLTELIDELHVAMTIFVDLRPLVASFSSLLRIPSEEATMCSLNGQRSLKTRRVLLQNLPQMAFRGECGKWLSSSLLSYVLLGIHPLLPLVR